MSVLDLYPADDAPFRGIERYRVIEYKNFIIEIKRWDFRDDGDSVSYRESFRVVDKDAVK